MDIVMVNVMRIAVVLSFCFVLYVTHQKPSRLLSYLIIYSVAVFFMQYAYLLEIQSTELKEAMMAVRFEYLAGSAATTSALFFTLELFHIDLKLIFRLGYISLHVFSNFMVATNERHHLHYTEASIEVRENFSALHFECGPIYVYHTMITLASMAVCVGVVLMGWQQEKRRKENQLKYTLLVTAASFPFTLFLVRFAIHEKSYDLIPLGLFLTDVCFVAIIFFFHIFDVAENAKNEVCENMEEGVLVYDEEGKVVFTNKKMREIFSDVEVDSASDILLRLTPVAEREFRYQDRFYLVRESEVAEGDQVKGTTLCFFDVTSLREKEQKLRELTEAAQVANRAKTNFLANMSHEIRTPINTILGMDEMILREGKETEILEYAEYIRQEGNTLLSLVDELLDISKLESGEALIRKAKFAVKIPQNVIDAAVEEQAKQCVDANAKEGGHEAPSSRLEVGAFTAPEARVLVVDDSVMNKLVVNRLLRRTGVQLDEVESGMECLKKTENTAYDIILMDHMMPEMDGVETLERIRKQDGPCKNTPVVVLTANAITGMKEYYLSVGFCAYISKPVNSATLEDILLRYLPKEKLVPLEATAVPAATEEGIASEQGIKRNGAPKEKSDAAPDAENPSESCYHQTGFLAPEVNMLVVDDSKLSRSLVKELLRPSRMHVEEAEDGATCLAMLEKGHYDVILLDQMMPGMDGLETVRLANERGILGDTKVLAISASLSENGKEFYIERGFQEVIGKPISIEKLEELLRRFLPRQKLLLVPEGYSYEAGLKHFDGDDQAYRETLRLFASIWPERREVLLMLFQEEDMKNYAVSIHGIKGDARTLGAEALAEMAYEQEIAAKAGNLAAVAESIERVFAVIDESTAYFLELTKNDDIKETED